MLPFLVCDLVGIIVVMALVFIFGIFAIAASVWELRLIITLLVLSLCVCKYYFKNCVINILFLFLQCVRCGIVQVVLVYCA